MSLSGRAVVVTGAGSGIGRATALHLAQCGAHLVLNDIDADGLRGTGDAVRALQAPCVEVIADAADEAAVAGLMTECQRAHGKVDGCFANAGVVGDLAPLTELSAREMLEVLRVNVLGPMLAIKYAAPVMVNAGRGAIVCTASVAAWRAGAGPAHYSASKAAIVSLVQSAAVQLAGSGVRVNAVCPGLVETGMTRPLFEAARAAGKGDRIGQLNPLRRAGEAREVAEVVAFLLGDASSYVNGQAVGVDGGLSSSHPFIPGRLW